MEPDNNNDNNGKPPLYNPATSGITGFLIDLDGTMYRPDGLIEGAKEFYAWLRDSGKPFVFLSNTGSKGSGGTRTKFMKPPFVIDKNPLNLRHIWTASEAQMNFMTHKGSETPNTRFADVDLGIPSGAQVFVLHGGTGEWLNALRMKNTLLFDSWDVRTGLSDEESMAWAQDAKRSQEEGNPRVFVVMFLDGELLEAEKHKTNFGSAASEAYEPDWSFGLLRKVSAILHNGGQLVYTADDAFNPSLDPRYPGMTFPLPGPGMFADMLKYLMHPCAEGQAVCAGKGGTHGDVFMMHHAIEMLKSQGHSGDPSTIMMIGDRFDTDIRGGCSVGVKTCLVESGAHVGTLQTHFPNDLATYCVPTVGHLINSPDGKAPVLRRPVVSFMGPLVRSSYGGVGAGDDGAGVLVRESTRVLPAAGAAGDFGIETTCISKLSSGQPLAHQIKGAVKRLTTALGGAKPNLTLVYTGASKAQTERVVDQIAHAFGTNVHCVSTYNGCMSDKGLTDDIGLWAIRDGAGQFTTGVATTEAAASAEKKKTPTRLASEAAAQAAQRWGSQGKPPQACFLSCSCGSEEQVIAELGVVFKGKGWDNVPVLGGTAAPASLSGGATPFVGSASGFDFVVTECGVAVTLLRVNSARHTTACGSLFPTTISEPATVTKVGANSRRVIAEINGVSAKEWYLTQLGSDSPASAEQMCADPFLTSLQPLSVLEAGGISRNIHVSKFNDDGSLETFANVDLHSKLVIKQATVGDLADPARAMGPALRGFTESHKVVGALAITCMGCTNAMMLAEREASFASASNTEADQVSILSHFRNSLHDALGMCTSFVAGATMGEQIYIGGSNQHANLMYSLMLFGEEKEKE